MYSNLILPKETRLVRLLAYTSSVRIAIQAFFNEIRFNSLRVRTAVSSSLNVSLFANKFVNLPANSDKFIGSSNKSSFIS